MGQHLPATHRQHLGPSTKQRPRSRHPHVALLIDRDTRAAFDERLDHLAADPAANWTDGYFGAVWLQTEFFVPSEWAARRVWAGAGGSLHLPWFAPKRALPC